MLAVFAYENQPERRESIREVMEYWLDCKFAFGGAGGKENFEVDIVATTPNAEDTRQLVKFISEVTIESED